MRWLAALFLFVGCSKSGSTLDDTQVPVVTIMTPTTNQTFTGGQSVNITAHLTDNARIVEVHVHIYNESTGELLIDIHPNPGNGDYALNENFTVQTGIQYKILVLAKDNSA